MFGLPNVTSVGSAAERIGRVLIPGGQPRTSRPHFNSGPEYRSGYEVRRETLGGERTAQEAMIANGRAREAQREAPILGRAIGAAAALAGALWLIPK
jgi:hypothetical protein